MNVSRSVGVAAILASLVLSGAVLAGELTGVGRPIVGDVDNRPWDFGTYHPNGAVTQFDNPRFTGSVLLQGGETVQASEIQALHKRHKIRLNSRCQEGDLLCVTDAIHSARPTQLEVELDGWVPFRATGARISHHGTTLELEKEGEPSLKTAYSTSVAYLDVETIVVPIHVVIEVPRDQATGNDGLSVMGRVANPLLYHALFDDDYSNPSGTFSINHPNGGLAEHTTRSLQPPERTFSSEQGGSIAPHYVVLQQAELRANRSARNMERSIKNS